VNGASRSVMVPQPIFGRSTQGHSIKNNRAMGTSGKISQRQFTFWVVPFFSCNCGI